ncbi:TRM11 family SAM-dependent methyltransferase [Hydrogenothermus marinus]|uniref:Methyltransferase n=1 Tax=Hydrogenothermus marinus TaxID=133270 RepID=A0A3M0BRY8_9AQUI|nr:DNA methyltransferase [Hydrogenothermus marinus]RMB00048.1 DNA methylase [Hydrogenothermus marinus]
MVKFKELLNKFEPFPFRDFRDEIKKGSYKKKSKFSYIGPDGEVYDIRNELNNLSGRKWLFFLNSIEITNYPTTGKESYGHELRKIHPSPKPPQLMKNIIEFFTKEGGWVFDPFMGVGGTLLGASLCRRNAVGIDISKKYIEVYKEVSKKLGLKEQITIVEDAKNIPLIFEDLGEFFDLILTDPPYCNMQARPKTGDKAKKRGKRFSTPFTTNPRDIGNINYNAYLQALKEIIEKAVQYLKKRKYIVIFIKDLQPDKNHHNMLHADIVSTLSEIRSLKFKGYKIWFDKAQNLYPFGYPFSYVSNQFHQFILIFRKEA